MNLIKAIANLIGIVCSPILFLKYLISIIPIILIEYRSKLILTQREFERSIKYHQNKMGLNTLKINFKIDSRIKRSTSDILKKGKEYKITLAYGGRFKNTEATLIHELLHIKNKHLDSLTKKQLRVARRKKNNPSEFGILVELIRLNLIFDTQVNHQIEDYWIEE